MLAGVPVADLAGIVIDKMVASGGWVVNDFVREVNGNRVFVVTARTPKDALTPEKGVDVLFHGSWWSRLRTDHGSAG